MRRDQPGGGEASSSCDARLLGWALAPPVSDCGAPADSEVLPGKLCLLTNDQRGQQPALTAPETRSKDKIHVLRREQIQPHHHQPPPKG